MVDDRAQMQTLESLIASSIIVMVMVFTIDATTLTPLTSSTANVHVEAELMALGQDIFSVLDYPVNPGEISPLKSDILGWNGNTTVWNGSAYNILNYTNPGDVNYSMSNNVTGLTSRIFVPRGIAHNLQVTYIFQGGTSTKAIIWNGDPSNNAIVVSRKIVIHDSEVSSGYSSRTGIQDVDASVLYNVVEVRLVLWRM
ncbi:MAG TPA: hypothetical protein HA257_01220 [Candidatus Methanoperedenaceae archaeon]|nr:hypothetical protein [Candidatus Methanoperedenaceae archaeon]